MWSANRDAPEHALAPALAVSGAAAGGVDVGAGRRIPRRSGKGGSGGNPHTVRRGGREAMLTRTEYKLLEYLAQRPDEVISTRRLLEHVWGPE